MTNAASQPYNYVNHYNTTRESRFTLYNTSICFINCTSDLVHFNISQKEIEDLKTSASIMIFDNTDLPVGGMPGNTPLLLQFEFLVQMDPNDSMRKLVLVMLFCFISSFIILTLIMLWLNSRYKRIKQQYKSPLESRARSKESKFIESHRASKLH
jgi:hypothetical protein